MATKKARSRKPVVTKTDVWKCADLKALIKERINAHVKDVAVARRLEQALADEIAYGTGGGGGHIGVA
jgi:hypothetical protein